MNSKDVKSICLFIVGPTASGKTSLSLALADWLHADIISADSRQIFRDMDIGTATPSEEELFHTHHYFINERSPDTFYSAGEFAVQARKIINQKMQIGENIIISGGSGLYVQAVLGMISDTPETDTHIRDTILARAENRGWPALFKEIQSIDPEYAKTIDSKNPKRICRALEIWESTGKKPSEIFQEKQNNFPHPYLMIGLNPKREFLYKRIDQRVLDMIQVGLVNEVKNLLQKGYTRDLNALNTVGYKEILAYLDGEIDLDKAISDIQKHTRHFAKRQKTWFRKYAPDVWISFDENDDFAYIFDQAKALVIKKIGNLLSVKDC